jgi:alkylhydroperoxidase family enzyme
MQAGATEDKVRAVAEAATSPLFTELERTALAYAEAITITGHKVTDVLFAKLRAHLERSAGGGAHRRHRAENFRSKFNVALGIEAQGFCVLR